MKMVKQNLKMVNEATMTETQTNRHKHRQLKAG